ncbi:MAG: hypothetical protein IJH54_04120 [Clostridia bacterium]|nr:hypothetical protein [Clostridia bacterium]
MFTILSQIIAHDFLDLRSSTHDERIIGLFQTLEEAQEAALNMARPIFAKALKAALEEEDQNDPNRVPFMDDGEVGVSVDRLPALRKPLVIRRIGLPTTS